MGKKRKSGGRSKGKKGVVDRVKCASCGRMVPRDKAKKKTTRRSLVDPQLARELRKKRIPMSQTTSIQYYCISCAVHRHHVKIRSKDDRKKR